MAATSKPDLAPGIAGWLVLAVGELRLALPQGEARQIELASDLDPQDGNGAEAGWLRGRGSARWPAYNLDPGLRVQRPAPAERHLCVFFGTRENTRGLLCDRVWSLASDDDLRHAPLPGCMTGPLSPVSGIARFQDGVAVVTSAAALGVYLDSVRE